jgi:hypothetical protein
MTIEQRETLRMAVLNFLAPRHRGAFRAQDIEERLKIERKLDFIFSTVDILDACELLVQLQLAQIVRESALSVTKYYQATGKGVIESERWRLELGLQ